MQQIIWLESPSGDQTATQSLTQTNTLITIRLADMGYIKTNMEGATWWGGDVLRSKTASATQIMQIIIYYKPAEEFM